MHLTINETKVTYKVFFIIVKYFICNYMKIYTKRIFSNRSAIHDTKYTENRSKVNII